jgi:TIR domain-containing protein
MQGRITTPSPGSRIISSRIQVEGVLTHIDATRNVWVVHRRRAGGLFWPKEPSIEPRSDGSFSLIAFEAGSPGRLVISLIAVDDRADRAFREWLTEGYETGHFPGLSPEEFAIAELDQVDVVYAPSAPARIFISYSHHDENFLTPLHEALATLKRSGELDAWDDRLIPGGTDVSEEIDQQLTHADLMLPLVSPSFINSDYCYNREMKAAIQRHRNGTMRVVPIILRPCDWQNTPLGRLKAIPKDGRAITTWSNQDEAWLDVSHELRRLLHTL